MLKKYYKTDYESNKKKICNARQILADIDLRKSYITLSNSEKNLLKDLKLNSDEYKSFMLNKKNMDSLVFPIFYNCNSNGNGHNSSSCIKKRTKKISNKGVKLPEINSEK